MSPPATKLTSLSAGHFSQVLAVLAPATAEQWVESHGGAEKAARVWHEAMLGTLDTKRARYAKSVARIVGAPADFYHAIAYCDFDSIGTLTVAKDLSLSLPEDADEKRAFWKALGVIARSAQEANDYVPTRVPTPDEIDRNIREYRKQKGKGGAAGGGARSNGPALSMNRAFHEALCKVAELSAMPDAEVRLRALPVEAVRELNEKWAEAAQGDAEAAIRGRDATSLSSFPWPGFEEDERPKLCKTLSDGKLWDTLESIVSFSKVQQTIPGDMMSKIESQAQRLSEQLMSGGSLEDIDLTAIGESVLAECSESDMSAVADRIGSLLPTLTSLQKNLPPGVGSTPPIDASVFAGGK